MSDVVIEASGLTKRYGARNAVDALDLSVRRGSICGFLGPNGAGKTTTIRMLLGLVRPTSGTARVLGHPLERRGELCARVGAIVEAPAFYPYLSALQNLRVLASASAVPVPPERLPSLLGRVGLSGRERDRAGTYSMGMKQRLGIAAALLTDPELLFLDEPTNGLDPAGVQEMRALIASFSAEGRTVFLSSHLLAEVEQICTDVVIIQAGRKVLESPISELLARGRSLAIAAQPQERALEVARGLGLEPRAEGGKVLVRGDADVPALVRALVAASVDVQAVEPQTATLEEHFLELTGRAA